MRSCSVYDGMSVMKPSEPKVTVIIPAYNQEKFLGAAIDSVLLQTFSDFEIVVIDDGSTDKTEAVARQYGEKIRYHYQTNRGLAGARNSGIRLARGELIGLLDADDVWLPEFLEKMTAGAQENPRAGVFYCRAICIDDQGIDLGQVVGRQADHSIDLRNFILRSNFLIPSTILIRKEIIAVAGLFDEEFKYVGCEDLDLWLRLTPENEFIEIPVVLAKYRVHESSLSADPQKMQRAMQEVIEKHFGPDDGQYDRWSLEKRRAYGGLYRNFVLTSIQRLSDWQSTDTLEHGFHADPSLVDDLTLFYELALGNQPFGQRGVSSVDDIKNNEEKIIDAIKRIFSSDLLHLRNRALGKAYQALSLVAYNSCRFSLCRRYFRLACRYRLDIRQDKRLWANYFKSFLGRPGRNFIDLFRGRRNTVHIEHS